MLPRNLYFSCYHQRVPSSPFGPSSSPVSSSLPLPFSSSSLQPPQPFYLPLLFSIFLPLPSSVVRVSSPVQLWFPFFLLVCPSASWAPPPPSASVSSTHWCTPWAARPAQPFSPLLSLCESFHLPWGQIRESEISYFLAAWFLRKMLLCQQLFSFKHSGTISSPLVSHIQKIAHSLIFLSWESLDYI